MTMIDIDNKIKDIDIAISDKQYELSELKRLKADFEYKRDKDMRNQIKLILGKEIKEMTTMPLKLTKEEFRKSEEEYKKMVYSKC